MSLSLNFGHLVRGCTFSLVFAVCLAPGTSSALDTRKLLSVSPSGQVIAERRVVEAFTSIRLETAARVSIRQGSSTSVVIEGEQNIVPLIETDTLNSVLTVRDGKRFASNNAVVVITVSDLVSLSTTGSVSVLVENFRTTSLELKMGDSSAVSLKDFTSTKLTAALGGSAVLRASGSTDTFGLNVGGSAAVEASRLSAREVALSAGGSSQSTVWAIDRLNISLGGSSSVNYYGVPNPKIATAGAAISRYRGVVPKQE